MHWVEVSRLDRVHFNPLSAVQFLDGIQSSEWRTVVEFRYIKRKLPTILPTELGDTKFFSIALASMNKLKIYQIGASIIAIPACMVAPEIFDPTVVTVMRYEPSGVAYESFFLLQI